jgi:hypothetical protein
VKSRKFEDRSMSWSQNPWNQVDEFSETSSQIASSTQETKTTDGETSSSVRVASDNIAIFDTIHINIVQLHDDLLHTLSSYTI